MVWSIKGFLIFLISSVFFFSGCASIKPSNYLHTSIKAEIISYRPGNVEDYHIKVAGYNFHPYSTDPEDPYPNETVAIEIVAENGKTAVLAANIKAGHNGTFSIDLKGFCPKTLEPNKIWNIQARLSDGKVRAYTKTDKPMCRPFRE
jgi:hypothetical protein